MVGPDGTDTFLVATVLWPANCKGGVASEGVIVEAGTDMEGEADACGSAGTGV
jgi:hypothetical protein